MNEVLATEKEKGRLWMERRAGFAGFRRRWEERGIEW